MGGGGAIKKPKLRHNASGNSFADVEATAQTEHHVMEVGDKYFQHALVLRAQRDLRPSSFLKQVFGVGPKVFPLKLLFIPPPYLLLLLIHPLPLASPPCQNHDPLQVGLLPGSRILHPYSSFSQSVSFLSSLLLLYTSISSAYNAGFYWKADGCFKTPTLYMDSFVDTFFLMEILLNFFTGIYIAGEYCDDLYIVATRYLIHGFLFDLLTSIPASYFEIATLQNCNGEGKNSDQAIRLLRLLKPIRLLKMLRTFRAVSMLQSQLPRGSELYSYISGKLRMPSFVSRVVKVMLVIVLIEHASASLFWLVKENSNTFEQVQSFLIDNNVHSCTDYYSTRCMTDKYIVATYFVVITFNTIGFGDISAVNTQERLMCILFSYISAMLFGALLAEVQEAMMQVNQHARDKSSLLNRLGDFMEKANLRHKFQNKILSWIAFETDSERDRGKEEEVLSLLCPNLCNDMKAFLHSSKFTSISYFASLEDDRKDLFIVALWDRLNCMLFPALYRIADFSKAGESIGLYFITKGSAVVLHDSGAIISSVPHGSHYGENMLVGKGPQPEGLELWSLTNVEVLFLARETFLDMVSDFGGLIAEHFDLKGARAGAGAGAGGAAGAAAGAASIDESVHTFHPIPAHVLHRWSEMTRKLVGQVVVQEVEQGGGASKNISELRQFSAAVAKCMSPSTSLRPDGEISPVVLEERPSQESSEANGGEEVGRASLREATGVELGKKKPRGAMRSTPAASVQISELLRRVHELVARAERISKHVQEVGEVSQLVPPSPHA